MPQRYNCFFLLIAEETTSLLLCYFPDAVITGIGNINDTLGVYRNSAREIELGGEAIAICKALDAAGNSSNCTGGTYLTDSVH